MDYLAKLIKGFLTKMSGPLGLILEKVLVPVINDRFDKLEARLENMWVTKKKFDAYDKEAEEIIQQAKKASTREEANALLSRLNSIRAKLN